MAKEKWFLVRINSPLGVTTHKVEAAQFTLGRSRSADVTISSQRISRNHLLVSYDHGKISLTDLKTSNGTMVGSLLIPPGRPFEYEQGTPISLGDPTLEICIFLEFGEMAMASGGENSFSENLPTEDFEGDGSQENESKLKLVPDPEQEELKNTALEEAQEILEQAKVKASSISKEAEIEAQRAQSKAQKDLLKQQLEAETENQELKWKTEEEINQLKLEAQKQLNELKEDARREIFDLHSEAREEIQELRENALREAGQIKQEAQSEAKSLSQSALVEARKAAEEMQLLAQKEKDQAEERAQKILEEAKNYAEQLTQSALSEISKESEVEKLALQKAHKQAQNVADEIKLKAQEDAEKILKNAFRATSILKSQASLHDKAQELTQHQLESEPETLEQARKIKGFQTQTFEELEKLHSEKETLLRQSLLRQAEIEAREKALEIKGGAEQEAEQIISEAYVQAKVLTSEAETQLKSIEGEIQENHEVLEKKKADLKGVRKDLEITRNEFEKLKNLKFNTEKEKKNSENKIKKLEAKEADLKVKIKNLRQDIAAENKRQKEELNGRLTQIAQIEERHQFEAKRLKDEIDSLLERKINLHEDYQTTKNLRDLTRTEFEKIQILKEDCEAKLQEAKDDLHDIELASDQAQHDYEKTLIEISSVKEEAELLLEEAQLKNLKARELEQKFESKKNTLENELHDLRAQALAEAQKIVDQAIQKGREQLSEAQSQIDLRRNELSQKEKEISEIEGVLREKRENFQKTLEQEKEAILLEAQDMAFQIKEEAVNESLKLKNLASHEADQMRNEALEIKLKSQKACDELIERARRDAGEVEIKAREYAEAKHRESLEKADFLRKAAEEEAFEIRRKGITESKNYTDSLKAEAYEEAEKLREMAHKESMQLIRDCELQIVDAKTQAQMEIEGLRREAEADLISHREHCLAELEELREKTFLEIEDIKSEAREDAQEIRKTALLKAAAYKKRVIKKIREKREQYYKEELEKEKLERKKRDLETQLLLQKKMAQTQEAAKLLHEEAKKREEESLKKTQEALLKSEELEKSSRARALEIINSAKLQAKNLNQVNDQKIQELEREIENLKTRAETPPEIHSPSSFEEMESETEEALSNLREENSKNFHIIKELKQQNEDLLKDHKRALEELKLQSQNEIQQKTGLQDLKKVEVQAAKAQRKETKERRKRENLIKRDFHLIKARQRQLWLILFFALSTIVGLGVVLLNPKIRFHVDVFLQKLKGSDVIRSQKFVDQVNKKHVKFVKYAPKQTATFKSSYTDNFLYTERYADIMTSGEYRIEWSKAMRGFIVDKLGLPTESLVQFLDLEREMLGELSVLRKKINGSNPSVGIQAMVQVETLTMNRLKEILQTHVNFVEFLRFRKTFFLRYRSNH